MCALNDQRNGDREQANDNQGVLLPRREGLDEPIGAGHDDRWVNGQQRGKGEGDEGWGGGCCGLWMWM